MDQDATRYTGWKEIDVAYLFMYKASKLVVSLNYTSTNCILLQNFIDFSFISTVHDSLRICKFYRRILYKI